MQEMSSRNQARLQHQKAFLRKEGHLMECSTLLVEVIGGVNDGDDNTEWSLDYEYTQTRVRPATYWQPAEGGEVEVEFDGHAVCTQTGERLTFDAFVERYELNEDTLTAEAEMAVCEDRHAFLSIDGPAVVAWNEAKRERDERENGPADDPTTWALPFAENH